MTHEQENSQPSEAVAGEIVAQRGNEVVVRLDNGEELRTVLSRALIRKLGCVFGTLVGYQAYITFRKPPKMPRVIDLKRPVK